MATVNLLNNGSNKSSGDMSKVIDYVEKEAKTSYEGMKLVTGINCPAQTAFTNMMLTKNYFHKTDGRMYYHLCQSFSPDEDITPELAHKVAVEFAEKQFPGYEIVVGTHVDREHIHSHILFNSVSFKDGKKYHSDKNDILRWRETSDRICASYGLSVVKPSTGSKTERIRTREYRSAVKGQSWKINLVVQIEDAMKKARTKKDFRRIMEDKGYQITWTDTRKNITYTTPEGKKCRDDKLHENKFLKEMMENEFRIRAELIGYQEDSGEQSGIGSKADSMRRDNGRELDGTSKVGSVADRDERPHGYRGADGSSYEGTVVPIQDSVGSNKLEGTLLEGRDDEPRRILDEEATGTGWEAERAICFGSEGFTNTDGWSTPKDVATVFDPGTSFGIGLGGLRLAADIGNLTNPTTVSDTPTRFKGMDKKEFKELAEKKQALGIRMGGM